MRLAACLSFGASLLLAAAGGAADAASSRLDDYLAKGRKLMQHGNPAGAAIEFKNAVQIDPKSGDAHYELGLAFTGTGNIDSAERELRAASAAGHDPGEVEVGLTEVFLKQERYGQLLDEIDDGDRPVATEVKIRMARGWAYYNLKRADFAEREFTSAMKLAPNPAEAEVGLAETRLVQDDFKGGAALLEKSVADDPHSVPTWVLLGRVRDILGERSAAQQALGQALKLAPDDPAALQSHAELIVDDDEAQAAKEVASVLERYPDNLRANLLDAIIKARRKDWPGAEAALLAIPGREDVPKALYLLARVKLAQGQFEQARTYITHYLAFVPYDPAAAGVWAALLIQQDKPRQAIDVLKKALVSHPDDTELLGLLSDAYTKAGQVGEAAATLERFSAAAPRDEETRLRLAMQFMRAGLPSQALDQLTSARASAALSAPAATLAIEAMFTAGKVDEAASAAEVLMRTAPNDPTGETLRGIVALRKDGVDAARSHFERALALDPNFGTAIIDLAQTYRLERRFDEARAVYDRALQHSSGTAAVLTARADLEVADGKIDAAISWLKRAIAADPRALEPRFRLVGIYMAKSDHTSALAAARELEATAPTNPQVVAVLAEVQLANNDRQGAIASLKRVLEFTQQAPDALIRLADVLVLDGKVSEAADAMRQAIESSPGDLRLQQAVITFALKTNMLADFIDFAGRLGQHNPTDPAIDELTGRLLEASGKYAAAVKAYSDGLAKGPSSRRTLALAQAQMRANDLATARATLNGWLATQPEDRAARFMLANVLASANDQAGAIAQYERLVADKSDDAIALNELAELYDASGDARAAATAERAFAVAPQSAIIADTLGWILVEHGASERGAALIRQAANGPSPPPTTRYHFAVVLGKAGQREEAKQVLGELLQSKTPFPERPAAEKLMTQLGG